MSTVNRRAFLKASGFTAIPLVGPVLPAIANSTLTAPLPAGDKIVNFIFDGEFYTPATYISKLQQLNADEPIAADVYSSGGVVAALEKKFTEITGKEKAMFMPSGTMANQLAIHVLSGENTKVFVQETSHVFRDEADAAQSVFNKRLIPLGKEQAWFTAAELQQAVDYYRKGEVFASGIGVVSIENPVRRADGRMLDIEELRRISAYCRKEGFKLHLDGARLHMASAWSGVSIAEYASLFDTVYISLYKCLGAAQGAMLCGDKAVMDKMGHLVKIHGGTVFRNWTNAAVALHHLDGLEGRLTQMRKRADELFAMLNQLKDVKVTQLQNGTNIFLVQLPKGIDGAKFSAALQKENIRAGRPNDQGMMRLTVNETILYQDTQKTFNAFRSAIGG
jgi:threonine aldolase